MMLLEEGKKFCGVLIILVCLIILLQINLGVMKEQLNNVD